MDIKSAFEKLFPIPEFPRVRKTDPITSHEAAEAIKPVVSHHFQTILECLQTYGPLGKDGISAMTNLDSNQVARRLNEMNKLGLIKLTGKTVRSNSGRSEREWTA
mgnify:CR=1 FL=1